VTKPKVKLLPDHLRSVYEAMQRKELTGDGYVRAEQEGQDAYRQLWSQALLLPGFGDLAESMASELGRYVDADPAEVRRRCAAASTDVHAEWDATVDESDRASVEAFYNTSQSEIYGLHWWHTLLDDLSPLAYVNALIYAQAKPGRAYLDFGSGVGSGGLLFADAGFEISLADISTPLLQFSRWRHEQRNIPLHFYDLKTQSLPENAFDIVTAMDVFEHLFDPVSTVETLFRSMRPGALLFGRIQADRDDNHRSGHIVTDFGPTHRRMNELGLREVWRDDWIWGHYCYEKGS
jgi:SAM-dependent methyltransferase